MNNNSSPPEKYGLEQDVLISLCSRLRQNLIRTENLLFTFVNIHILCLFLPIGRASPALILPLVSYKGIDQKDRLLAIKQAQLRVDLFNNNWTFNTDNFLDRATALQGPVRDMISDKF